MSPAEINPNNFLIYLNGKERVAEWNGNIPREWGMTCKESTTWSASPHLITEMDKTAILDAFGLLAWQSEFPLEVLRKTSPAELMNARRKKEATLGLKKINVFRDGSTNWKELPAEKFD